SIPGVIPGTSTTPVTLTIGPAITLHGTQSGEIDDYYYGTDILLNQGTIRSETSGKTITIKTGTTTNQGTIEGLNGGSLSLNALQNALGQTVSISNGGTLAPQRLLGQRRDHQYNELHRKPRWLLYPRRSWHLQPLRGHGQPYRHPQ
ncbi:hypothetical protein, partial [Syntrophorhabdus aromaticivorans]|uniref:hypothetical protein n=1 Tax=Syntrophorhabdus aromaticivorans TaxID=328301 RepID=UPI001FA6BBBF